MEEDEYDNVSCEPMDVDRSLNSSGISSPESPAPSSQILIRHRSTNIGNRKEHKPFEPNLAKVKRLTVDLRVLERKNKGKLKKVLALFMVIIIFISSSYYWLRSNCCPKSALPKVHGLLLNKLYGQDRAIEQIMESFLDGNKSKITFFYGSTGVGKTYASQIIFDQMVNYSNILQFSVATFFNSFSTRTVQTELSLCDFVFIVVDDVLIDDAKVKKIVRDVIDHNNLLQKNIHLILIYNSDIVSKEFQKTDNEDFKNIIDRRFSDIDAKKYFVHFDKLTDIQLKMCVDDAMSFYKYRVDSQLINKILNNFNVAFDGCKGVDSKIKGMKLDKF